MQILLREQRQGDVSITARLFVMRADEQGITAPRGLKMQSVKKSLYRLKLSNRFLYNQIDGEDSQSEALKKNHKLQISSEVRGGG